MMPPAPPFPLEAVRDLLGLVRALYAAAQASGASREHLARIAKVGSELSRALDLAGAQGEPGHAAAWQIAEKAMLTLGDLAGPLTPALPIVQAAVGRVEVARRAQKQKSAAGRTQRR